MTSRAMPELAGGTPARDEALPAEVRPGYNVVPTVMQRVRQELPLHHLDPATFDKPKPDELARPAVGPNVQTYDRPWDKSSADYFTGQHMLILRPTVMAKGRQEPIGLPTPIVYRPTPLPWWCGTTVTPTTPPPKGTP